jgi:uncharacterized RDD family membrane protein YckC
MNSRQVNNNYRYAGLWRRFWGLLIDFVFLSAFFFPITRIVKGTWLMGISDHRWSKGFIASDPICLVFFIIIVLYFILLEGIRGATIGKWMAGTRVVNLDGGKPGITKSIIRNVLRAVDSLPAFNIAGVILIARSKERARFGDRVAGTRVIIVHRR